MSAVFKRATGPRTLEDIIAELHQAQARHKDLFHLREIARRRIPNLITMGDTDTVESCRAEMVTMDGKLAQLTELIAQLEEAKKCAVTRDTRAQHERNKAAMDKSRSRIVEQAEAFEAFTKEWGKAYIALRNEVSAGNDMLISQGLPAERCWKLAHLEGVIDLLLWVESDRTFGRNKTPYSTVHELRQSGLISLVAVARSI